MRRIVPAVVILGSMLGFSTSASMAMGFGRVDNATVLGHPLDFSAGINIDTDEWIAQECVAAEVLSGDNKLAPAQVRVRLSAPTPGTRPTVHVTTTVGIDEPVVTVKLMLGCPPRLSREFVAFVDPPLVGLPQTPVAQTPAPPVAATTPATPSASESAQTLATPAPIASAVAPRVASRAAPRRARRPAVVATAGPRAAPTAPRAASAPGERSKPAVVARAAPAASGPRLMLEPAQAMLKSPAPAASATVPSPTAPLAVISAADAVDAQARERQRMSGVEDRLERMLKESAVTQQTVAALQARLRDTEAARRTSPLVYGLLALVGLMLMVIVALLWRQSRMKQESAWWRGAAEEAERAPTPSELMSATRHPAADRTAAQMRVVAPPEAAPVNATTAAKAAAEKFAAEASASVAEPVRRELTVEELIDLEQQAEFFIVLGQDEAAIDLLMSHVRSSGGASPMPYLKLLDIYRRRDDREAYARIRERFNRRFNAYAPDWDADPRDGRTLEGYPVVMNRLQAAWPHPAKAMELLESLLFRRDSSDGTFDLPAYGELLFLYALARDLAEHEPGPGAVDLLLPLNTAVDEEPDVESTVALPNLPLIHIDTDTPEVDVELDLGAPQGTPKP